MSNSLFKRVTEALQEQLSGPLPGISAQQKMIPEGRSMVPDSTITPQKSAVLLLLYPEQNQVRFPLIKRPEYNGIHSGQMALPGGKFEETDKNLIQTALRESCEEIGICHSAIEIIGTLSEVFISVSNMLILPVVAKTSVIPDFVIDPVEVAGLYTVQLSDLLNPELKFKEWWNIRGTEILIPYYLLNNQKVWGATAMMLSELEHLLRPVNLKE